MTASRLSFTDETVKGGVAGDHAADGVGDVASKRRTIEMKELRCMMCGAKLPHEFVTIGVCEDCAQKIVFTVERRSRYIEQAAAINRRFGG